MVAGSIPPPVKTIPPPLLDPALPPATGPAKSKKGQKLAAAPAVPKDSVSGLEFPMDEGAEVEAHGPSLIGRTSLIGFCVGITGLLGLILWRYLDRRSHRARKINPSILNTPASSAMTGAATDRASKSNEPSDKVEAPRLHRAA